MFAFYLNILWSRMRKQGLKASFFSKLTRKVRLALHNWNKDERKGVEEASYLQDSLPFLWVLLPSVWISGMERESQAFIVAQYQPLFFSLFCTLSFLEQNVYHI